MSDRFPAPKADRDRMNDLAEYVRGEVAARGGDGPVPKIELHYHAAPVVIDPTPVDPNAGDALLRKYTPYFVVMIGGVIVLASVAVIAVMLVPVLMSMVVMIAVVMLGFAVASAAVAATVKSLRQSASDRDVVRQAVKRRRRR